MCRRNVKHVEGMFSSFLQEFAECQHFWRTRELMRDQIVLIKNADRRSIFHDCSDMRPEMNDCAALQVLSGNFRRARWRGSGNKIKIFAQSFRVRPRNALALPAQRVHDEVCAIGTKVRFRSGIRPLRQFAAAEKIRQTELLANRGSKTGADKPPQFDHGRFAKFAVHQRAYSQTQRATVEALIEQIVDLRYRQDRVVALNRNLAPGRTRCGVRDKANLIDRQIGEVAARVFRRQRKPLDLLWFHCPRINVQFDFDVVACRYAPHVVCARLAISNPKAQLRRLVVPDTQQSLPTCTIVLHSDAFTVG